MKRNVFKNYLVGMLLVLLSMPVSSVDSQVLANESSTDTLISDQIKDVSAAERSQIKAHAIAEIKSVPKQKVGDYSIEIVNIKETQTPLGTGGVEVFARAWNSNNEQIGFGFDGTVDVERFVIINPPIRVPDGTKTLVVQKNEKGRLIYRYERDNLKENSKQAILLSIAHTIELKREKAGSENIVAGKVGNTTTTIYPDANVESVTVDGYTANEYGGLQYWNDGAGNGGVRCTGSNSNGISADDSGTTLSMTWRFGAKNNDPTLRTFYGIRRIETLFDTSGIADDDTVDSATLSLYVLSKTNSAGVSPTYNYNITTSTPATNTAIVASDHQNFGNASLASSVSYDNLTASAYNTWTMTATGRGQINKTGITKLALRQDNDIAGCNSYPENWSSNFDYHGFEASAADTSGSTQDPKLVIEHFTLAPVGVFQDLSYTYDANGNITQIVDNSETATAKTIDFTYDDLNRLTLASTSNATSGNNYRYVYNYDAIGNITSSTPAGTYVYGSSTCANPHAATAVSSTVYTYDNSGNLTSDGTWTHTWDYRNRITQSTKTGATSTYQYDHNNTRVRMANGTTTLTEPSRYYSTEGSTKIKYIYVGDQMVATVRGTSTSTATVYSIHTDHLGSPVVTANASGTVQELTDYYPSGNVRLNTQLGGFDDRKGFLGKDSDFDTGLSQLEARYYKGAVGRFMSQDPVFWSTNQKLIDPQSLNSYSYANNNPITYSDPNGREAAGFNVNFNAEAGLVGIFGAGTFSIGLSYVRNPDTGEVWLALPISFGATAGTSNHYLSYPETSKPPMVIGAYAGAGPGLSYSPNAKTPEDLRGEEEISNINMPLVSISAQGEGKKSPSYSASLGTKALASASQYQVKSWAPAVNLTSISASVQNFANSIGNSIAAQINYIQAQINEIRYQIQKISSSQQQKKN